LGVGEIWHFFEQQIDYPLTLVNERNLKSVNWDLTDVLILADGSYDFLEEKAGVGKLKDWVKDGGKLIAIEDAVVQLAGEEWGFKEKKSVEEPESKEKKEMAENYDAIKSYGNRERESVKEYIPGAIFKVQMDNTHPLAFGYGNVYYTLKQNSHLYDFISKDGWNVGVLKKDNYLSGFVGANTRNQLKDGLLFGVKELGSGNIVILADNPLFRSFWENGKVLFSNAVFLVGQ
jgi:hypothetical protein